MPDIVLTEGELEVLARCSGVSVKCYLRLRARMDFETGVVGLKSGMSYQALREWSEEVVEKGAGEEVIQPTYKQVRVAIDQLCRRGLLHRLKTEKLAFLCRLARYGEVRSNQTGHEQGRAKLPEQGTEQGTNRAGKNASNGAYFDHSAWAEQGTEQGTNRAGQNCPNRADIRYQSKPSTSQAASTTGIEGGSADGLSAAEGLAAGWKGLDDLDPVSRRVIELVAWLRRNGAAVTAADPRVRRWVEEGIDEGLIAQALDVAKDDRGPSPQPINAGLLDAIVRRLLAARERPRRRNWAAASDVELEGRARDLGIHSVGRSRADVVAAIVAREQGGEVAA